MNNINSISSTRFGLNNIQYVRNYISAVYGNDIEIFNCYERKDVLVPRAHYSEFRINGVTYSSAAALQSVLLSIIYSRTTLGAGALDQDNIDVRKYFSYTANFTTSQILQKINALPQYTVSEVQSVWFIGRTYSLQPGHNNGPLLTPYRPVSMIKYKMLNKGKGTYGAGGIQLTTADIELVYYNSASESDIASDPGTVTINFGNLTSQSLSAWINQHTEPLIFQPQEVSATLLRGTINNNVRAFIWTGISGTYGAGQLQATMADLQELDDTPPEAVPTLQQVADRDNKSFTPINLESTANKSKISYTGAGSEFIDEAGKIVSIGYDNPTHNVKYAIPAKSGNDTFAMVSDSAVQKLKHIDSLLTDSTYTITEDDFGKTLIYSGIDNINMLLSTNVNYSIGNFLNFIQSGPGSIKLVIDGFIIKHSLDELPETYGSNSVAGLTITDEYLVMIFGKLKLAD